jgi:hypothetical protein|uniref:Uncharacterized protein n=1 Tax=viral metagenome TaxID=1070528 RepID=A0A6C0IKP1_9ZZZZ
MRSSRTLKKRTRSSSKSRSKSRSKSKSKSRSKSKSSSSSSIGGPLVLRREYQQIKITKKEAIEIIKNRVKRSQLNPPSNWEKWNKENAKLFKKGASVPYPEYNEILDNNI